MIDRLGLLRQALAGLQRASASQPQRDEGAANARPVPPGVRDGQTLSETVRRRVASIAPDDPGRRKRVLRAVVESALAREFGASLESDPEFHKTVEEVVLALESAPDARALVDAALQPFLEAR
jgi:hypothetical protein